MFFVPCRQSFPKKTNRGINLLKRKWFGRVYLGFTTHQAGSRVADFIWYIPMAKWPPTKPLGKKRRSNLRPIHWRSRGTISVVRYRRPKKKGLNGALDWREATCESMAPTVFAEMAGCHCLCRKTKLTPKMVWSG